MFFNINALHTNCGADVLLFSFFHGFEKQGLATAVLVPGSREISLHFVADWMLVLVKQGRSLRSEIILIVAVAGDGDESGFCRETITCRKVAMHDNFDPTYFSKLCE
jgi:hypothetical protein